MIQNFTLPVLISSFLHEILLVQVENLSNYFIILHNIQLNGG